jgi:hypothetical protein
MVPCILDSYLPSSLIDEVDVLTSELVLCDFVVCLDTKGAHFDLGGGVEEEDGLGPIHQEERCVSGGPTCTPSVKVVNDTSTCTTTRAARCGSMIGGDKSSSCSAQACKVDTRIFMWFRLPECNTLRPQCGCYIAMCVLQARVELA